VSTYRLQKGFQNHSVKRRRCRADTIDRVTDGSARVTYSGPWRTMYYSTLHSTFCIVCRALGRDEGTNGWPFTTAFYSACLAERP
jgi:hypothetical protein